MVSTVRTYVLIEFLTPFNLPYAHEMKEERFFMLSMNIEGCCLLFSGLCVNDKYLVAQYHIEGGIDVYDRVTLKHLFRLHGHEYGGQCIELSENILYSASLDFSLKSWNLESQKQIDSTTDHCDYVQCLAVKNG